MRIADGIEYLVLDVSELFGGACRPLIADGTMA
jgi:hypothetical protein